MRLYPDAQDADCVIANLATLDELDAAREKEALDYARLHGATFVLCWKGEQCFRVLVVAPEKRSAA